MTMKHLYNRLAKRLYYSSITDLSNKIVGTLTVDGKRIECDRLLGAPWHPGITKAGRLSVSGTCDIGRVKVYSTHSFRQAALRKDVQNIPLGKCRFAELVASDDRFVVEKWVDGVPVSKLTGPDLKYATEAVKNFLERLESDSTCNQIASNNSEAFCYFEDYLVSRLGVWALYDQISEFLDQWKTLYKSLSNELPVRLTHADLSLNNVFLEKDTGDFVIIDNELLGVGRGWVLDWHNSLLNKMGCDVPPYLSKVSQKFINKSWQLRRLGSALDANDFTEVNNIICR